MRTFLEYLEKPVTADEKLIASVFEKVVNALKSSDVKSFLCGYLNTAFVINKKEERVGIAEHAAKILKTVHKLRILSYKDILIRVLNEKEAVLICTGIISLKENFWPETFLGYFKFVNNEKAWYISEVRHL